MSPELLRKPLYYDAARRRLWIYGQRCHHGATGALLAATGAAGVAARLTAKKATAPAEAAVATGVGVAVTWSALVATGGLLMAHDWKDRTLWFQRGWQNQP